MCKMIAGLIAGLTMILMSNAVGAQSNCAPHNEVVDQLAKKYGEAPVAIGVTSGGGLVEVLTTSDGTTWTMILSMPNGTTCLVAAGEGWRVLKRDDSLSGPST